MFFFFEKESESRSSRGEPPRRQPGPANSRRWRARHGELDVTMVKSGRGLESNAGDLADTKPAIAFHRLSRAALGDGNPLPVERDQPENSMSFQIFDSRVCYVATIRPYGAQPLHGHGPDSGTTRDDHAENHQEHMTQHARPVGSGSV